MILSNSNIYSKGKIVFTRDEGHRDTPLNWWYLTSHFATKDGRKFSYTVAYLGLNSSYYIRQTSITDESKKEYFSQLKRGPFTSQKGLLDVTYSNSDGDRDHWCEKKDKPFNYNLFTEIRGRYCFKVELTANKPPLVHGDGIIQMGKGGGSYYYSITNLSLEGTFIHDGIVEAVKGIAWIDHQWGEWKKGYAGWEWFALQLNDNTEIMLYLFYDAKTGSRINSCFSIMFENGSSISFNKDEFVLQPLDYWEANQTFKQKFLGCLFLKHYFSSGWKLKIPKFGIALTIIPVMKEQRVGNSWEGSCYVQGTHNDVLINTIGSVELTYIYGEPYALAWAKDKFLSFYQKSLADIKSRRGSSSPR